VSFPGKSSPGSRNSKCKGSGLQLCLEPWRPVWLEWREEWVRTEGTRWKGGLVGYNQGFALFLSEPEAVSLGLVNSCLPLLSSLRPRGELTPQRPEPPAPPEEMLRVESCVDEGVTDTAADATASGEAPETGPSPSPTTCQTGGPGPPPPSPPDGSPDPSDPLGAT
jgi:hypothetical protein